MDNLDKFNKIANEYGIDAINLCIERHHLSKDKRNYWIVQFSLYKEDEIKNKQQIDEYKEEISKITEEIEKIDVKLKKYGITSKNRPGIIKIVKSAFPVGWEEGFVIEQ